jgi:pilus assembly protein CpaF
MFIIIITDKQGEETKFRFEPGEISIGRATVNDIILPHANVSKRHAKLVQKNGKFIITDLKSTNGTYVNNRRIDAPCFIKITDEVRIGDFLLRIEKIPEELFGERTQVPFETLPRSTPPPLPPTVEITSKPTAPTPPPIPSSITKEPEAFPSESPPIEMTKKREETPALATYPEKKLEAESPLTQELDQYATFLSNTHETLAQYLEDKRIEIESIPEKELWTISKEILSNIIKEEELNKISSSIKKEEVIKDVLNEAMRIGVIEELLKDNQITRIIIYAPTRIYIERNGELTLSSKIFSSLRALKIAIERLLTSNKPSIDVKSQIIDLNLSKGERFLMFSNPLVHGGPYITISKRRESWSKPEEILKRKVLSPQMAEFLKLCISTHQNILIFGGLQSGKTTLFNFLINNIPAKERVLIVGDSNEIQAQSKNCVVFNAQELSKETLRLSLNLSPTRLLYEDLDKTETLKELLWSINKREGAIFTLCASSQERAFSHLKSMLLTTVSGLLSKDIWHHIASLISIIVEVKRFTNNAIKVIAISEVIKAQEDKILIKKIFKFEPEDKFKDPHIGQFSSTGNIPSFLQELKQTEIIDTKIFQKKG